MEQKKKRILIVEDERDIAEILKYNVEKQGYEAEVANDGEKGLALGLSGTFDLILLDVMLPKLDGFEICRRVRSRLETPIIMLTAREEENDKILGLDLGADDYMTKPFSLGELISRIKANIRRYSGETVVKSADAEDDGKIILDELEIDTNAYSVKKNGEEISLSKQQYELLVFLAKNRGKKYRQDALLEAVWGYDDYYGDVRTVDVTVARLRKQIEDNPSEPKFIKNKRGMGYYID
ncbi:MAG: response regulator transcription factor [Ruminococcaceae bacterium]|nr:response regulator transcription factor [Oscillospiraceae bacterium]